MQLENHLTFNEATIKSPNLCDQFTDGDLAQIGQKVWEGYEIDKQSRKGWFQRMEAAMDLAMQVSEEKTFPWPNASNVVFPLVTIAALQFHSRAYPTLVNGKEIVKCRVAGYNPTPQETDRAYRVGCHMSYQVLEEDPAWEEQHDRLLINLPVVGCAFKKSYYNGGLQHNTSELVHARDFVIHYFAKNVTSARRKTHIIPIYRNDIFERCESGLYRDVRKDGWYSRANIAATPETSEQDARQGTTPPPLDDAAPLICLEQHVWFDLDDDGYEEPYIILIEETSQSVLRIVARCDRIEDVHFSRRGKIAKINAVEYFTKYTFIPSPDGGIYDLGFGILLGPLNESVNSLVNQLIDAGTMANTAGGFLGRGAKIRGGVYSFVPMEWKRVDSSGDDLSKSIFPLPVREPSDVLFKLLSLLIEYVNRVSGATEMLMGENPGQNTPAATSDLMVEQGLKIYAAIFKRVWRGMKEEFKKLYILNAINLPLTVYASGGIVAMREDYLGDPNRIVPAADPNVVSDVTRFSQARLVAERSTMVPGYDVKTVEMNLLRAARVEAPETIYVGVEKTGGFPNPKLQIEEIKTQREQMKLRHQAEMFVFEMEEQHFLNEAKISQLEAAATKLLADAKGIPVQDQINTINAIIAAMKAHNEDLAARAKLILESKDTENGDQSRAIQHLVGRPGDKVGSPAASQMAGGPQGPMGAGGIPR